MTSPNNANPTALPQALQPLGRGEAKPLASGLYIHIPFCFHKCHYCDFYSIVSDEASGPGKTPLPQAAGDRGSPSPRHAAFVDRLIAELAGRRAEVTLRPTTIFVGGGTPTLLSSQLWQYLLSSLHRLIDLDHIEEFTVEANPETVSDELADILAAGGVNRVSIGAQSFNPTLLQTLERWHDPASVERAIAAFRRAGIDNINLDLIFAIPGQTMTMLEADLQAALDLAPRHLSCYSLIFEPHTPLHQRMQRGQIEPVDEEIEGAMYELVMERLAEASFEHYEVSNWAKRIGDHSPSPHRCQHNMLYWSNGNWLGIGPSAASHLDGHRWKNEPHLGRYMASGAADPPTVDHERLGPDARLGEQLMLGLRLRDGVSDQWLATHLPADDRRRTTIDQLITWGMLERSADRLRLTPRGLFIADTVIGQLL